MRNPTGQKRKSKGFVQTGALITTGVRSAAEKRGFAETRLLTNWVEIVGPEMAKLATPQKVTYRQEGFGATLVVTCEGARAPELSMQLPVIKDRVNACYGYNAIARVRIIQGQSTGFREAAAVFTPKAPSPVATEKAHKNVEHIADSSLRDALQKLGENVISRQTRRNRGN